MLILTGLATGPCFSLHNKMANQVNGNVVQLKEEEDPMDTSSVTHTEHYKTLIESGLPQKVAERLDEIFQAGLVAYVDLDERAVDALREFNEEGPLSVLQQFKESDLSHVQNKSAFLCGVMKTYRQREKQGSKVQESTKGPDEVKIKALLERIGYTLDVTTGQRKYGGPPPDSVYSGTQPGIGREVFVGKIPRDLYEDELVPLFEKAGPIWDLCLRMDPLSGQTRGYHLSPSVEKKLHRKVLNCVTAMKFVLVNTWEYAFLWQTTGFLLDQFQRIRLKKTFWKNSVKSQVKQKCI